MIRIIAAVTTVIAVAALWAAQDDRITFRAESRLVEVYATVVDQRGRYADNLVASAFGILDNGAPQKILSFENSAASLSCAILLDTTASMAAALPKVKNAIFQFVDEFRDEDALAVYTFSTSVERRSDFTTDKSAAKKAILRTRAEGGTALFDAIARVAADVSTRSGKKAIVVFTDGDDNSSVLNARRAMDSAKKLGVPLYTAAEGQAIRSPALLGLLKELAQVTGGKSYTPKNLNGVAAIFQDISDELRHTYWLTYQAPTGGDGRWRRIEIVLKGFSSHQIRAKEGYYSR